MSHNHQQRLASKRVARSANEAAKMQRTEAARTNAAAAQAAEVATLTSCLKCESLEHEHAGVGDAWVLTKEEPPQDEVLMLVVNWCVENLQGVPAEDDPFWETKSHYHMGYDKIIKDKQAGLPLMALMRGYLWPFHLAGYRCPNVQLVFRRGHKSPMHQDVMTGADALQRCFHMATHSPACPAALRVLLNLHSYEEQPRFMEFDVKLPDGSYESLLRTHAFLTAMPAGPAGTKRIGNLRHGRWGSGVTFSADFGLKLLPGMHNIVKVVRFTDVNINMTCYKYMSGHYHGLGHLNLVPMDMTAAESAAARAAAATALAELGELAPHHCFWCGTSILTGYEGCWAYGDTGRRWCDSCFYQLGKFPERFNRERWSTRPFHFCGADGCPGCSDDREKKTDRKKKKRKTQNKGWGRKAKGGKKKH